MLAMSPPGPEELPALEAEIEQLRRALALCDVLPCRGAAAQPAGDGQGKGRVQADAEQGDRAARKRPVDDEPSPAAARHAQRAQSVAGKPGVRAEQPDLPGPGHDGQALDTVVVSDSDDGDFKQAPQPRRRPQQQPVQQRRQRPPRAGPSGKAALHVGDAVEVAWEMGGRLGNFVGHVLAVKQVNTAAACPVILHHLFCRAPKKQSYGRKRLVAGPPHDRVSGWRGCRA